LFEWRTSGLPGSWRTPLCACPALRPRRDGSCQAITACPCSLPFSQQRQLPRSGHFGAQSPGPTHSLSTLRSTSYPVTTQDSLPAGSQPLPGGTGYPLGPSAQFQDGFPFHPFHVPRLAWRTENRPRATCARKPTRIAGLFRIWGKRFDPLQRYRTGLSFLDGYVFREEPCTDPYARFCGQTEACGPPLTRSNKRPSTRRQVICGGHGGAGREETGAAVADAGRTRAAEGKACRQFFAPEIGRTHFRFRKKWRHNH
jgi:hypothetical protein